MEELASLRTVLDRHTAIIPQASHLLALLSQRARSLACLQKSARQLASSRDDLAQLTAALVGTVEDALDEDGQRASRSKVKDVEDVKAAEEAFLVAYRTVTERFEASWSTFSGIFEAWDLAAPLPSTSKHTLESTALPSWITNLSPALDASNVVLEFLRLSLRDSYALGAGLATLEGPALASLLPEPAKSPLERIHQVVETPLMTLLALLAAARGPEAVESLALGAFETAVRELVGREASRSREGNVTGPGARERELEVFLVGLLDTVEGMGLDGAGPGPLHFHRGIEDILLELLHDTQHLYGPSLDTQTSPSVGVASETWGSKVSNTLSTVASIPVASIYSVATISGAGISSLANAAGLSLPTSASSPNLASSSFMARTQSASRFSSSPSSPKLDTPKEPRQRRTTPSEEEKSAFLNRSATRLLEAFTPTAGTTIALVVRIISNLLTLSFPLSSSGGSYATAHRKVLLITVVRWWAFSYLGRKIGRAGTGGGFTAPSLPWGIALPSEGASGPSTFKATANSADAVLDEVFVKPAVTVDILLGVHKVVYEAIVSATGFGAPADPPLSDDRRALQKAAKLLVQALGGGTVPARSQAGDATSSPPSRELRSFVLSSGDFRTLLESFGALVLRSPAAPPTPNIFGTPSQTFKRSGAFGTASSKSTTNLNGSEEPDLQERLHLVAGELTGLKGPSALALLFTDNTVSGFHILDHVPLCDASTKTTTPDGTPPNRASSKSVHSPSPKQPFDDTPLGSPRHEALLTSLKPTSPPSYFSMRSRSPSATSPLSPIAAASQTLKQQKRPTHSKLSEEETKLVSKAVISLAQDGRIALLASDHHPDVFTEDRDPCGVRNRLILALTTALALAHREHDFTREIMCENTVAILRAHSEEDASLLVISLTKPYRKAYEHARKVLDSTQLQLTELEASRRRLLDEVRRQRSALDSLRIRSWYSSFKLSALACELRKDIQRIPTRSISERDSALRNVTAWTHERGLPPFTNCPGSVFEECLMLVEGGVARAMDPGRFYDSPLWSREHDVLKSLLAGHHPIHASPSFAETLISSSTTILTAPLALAGLPYPTLHAAATAAQPPRDVVLSFGAACPSLLKPQEASTAFLSAVEDHLARVGLKLSAYLWSDVAYTFAQHRDSDGRLVGADAWYEEFASPLSPLVRSSPAEVERGTPSVPKAYHPSSSISSPSFGAILKRFSMHPSPQAKMHSLFELEVVLSAIMTAPTATTGQAGKPRNRERNPARPQDGEGVVHVRKLANIMSKRFSIGPSPIAKLLEGEEEESHKESKVASSSRRQREISSTSTLTSVESHVEPPTTETLANTDNLVGALEDILRIVRPERLFQNLQIVASLVPSAVLDGNFLGKAFWDVALAALSVRRDVVEGPFGVLARGQEALGEGTDEGRELAERLVRIAAEEEAPGALDLMKALAT